MIKDQIQKQESGNKSTNLQSKSIIIHQGISYADAKEIAIDVFKANIIRLSENASKLAVSRAEEMTDIFLEKLKKRSKKAIESMSEPGMQMALYSAQKEYVKSGHPVIRDFLIKFLIDKSESKYHSFESLTTDACIETIPKLTEQMINCITLVYAFRTATWKIKDNLQFERFYDQVIEAYLNGLLNNKNEYLYLTNVNCAHAYKNSKDSLENLFIDKYPGLFSKGFTNGQLKKIRKGKSMNMKLRKSYHFPHLLEFGYTRKQEIWDSFNSNEILDFFMKKLMDTKRVYEYLMKININTEALKSEWKQTFLKNLRLTNIGVAIAQANLDRSEIDCPELVDRKTENKL